MDRILQTPTQVTGTAMSLLNSLVLLLLFTTTTLGQSALINRSASNTVKCDDQTEYGVYLKFDNLENHYSITDGQFTEYEDGTADFSAVIINNDDSSIKFNLEVTFSDRTYHAPDGSPKSNMCYNESTADWYYYTTTRGSLTGLDYAAGAQIIFDRRGPAFQVGTGANVTDSEIFGGSGWLDLVIRRQPYSNLQLSGSRGDINIRLSGSSLPEDCDNLTSGGKIGNYELACEPFDAANIVNLESPSGGNNAMIQYIWMTTTDPSQPVQNWTMIPGANSDSYDPGIITETTYFLRCARRLGCIGYYGESNVIAKIVNGDDQALDCGIDTKKQISGDVSNVLYNSGVDYATNLLGAIDGEVAKFHDENDYIVVKLDEELEAGQQYTISWKYRNYTSGYANAEFAKLEVYESIDGNNFSFNTTLHTDNKQFLVHQTLTATTNTRYLKLANSTETPDFQVDAVSFCNSICENNNPTACVLQNHGTDGNTGADRLVWLKLNDGTVYRYQIDESTAQLIEYKDGTAFLVGTLSRINDPCYQFAFSVKLLNKSDWDTWSALGRSYKPNNAVTSDHTTWSYYELDEFRSSFTGLNCHQGESIQLTHSPSNLEYGFQVGVGANLKNGSYGISGWFEFTGDFNGHGDFNGNLGNCEEVDNPQVVFGNRVFEDINGNGIQDDGEPGIEGVKIGLAGADINGNGVTAETVTNQNGEYTLTVALPGTYKFVFSQLPPGFFATARDEGNDEAVDSDVLPLSGCTLLAGYGFGQHNDIDAGYFQYASVGNLVWEDKDGDGKWDGIEPGISGVTVNLQGATGAGEVVNKTTSTNGNGIYFFDGLTPGNYTISFDIDPDYQVTFLNVGGDDSVDNDVFPSLSTANFGLFSGDLNNDMDAGFYLPVTIGATSFDDLNNNSIRDNDDVLVQDLTIRLLRKASNGIFDTYESQNSLIDGTVLFENVPPGEYKLQVDETTLPTNYVFIPNPNSGVNDNIDSDVNATGMINGIILKSGDPDDLSFGVGIINQSILPVELLYFTADLYRNNRSLLQWATASELDNRHFVIQRSLDGKTFETIDVVAGVGNSSELNEYSYVDKAPYFGKNYYRLKQVDFNGDYDFSSIQSVSVERDGVSEALAYPNPTKDRTTLRVVEPYEADAKITVVNTLGQTLKTLTLTAGKNSLTIDLSAFEAGFYYIQLEYQGRQKLTMPVLKIQD